MASKASSEAVSEPRQSMHACFEHEFQELIRILQTSDPTKALPTLLGSTASNVSCTSSKAPS